MVTFGLVNDKVGVKHVPAPDIYFGEPIPEECRYSFAVEAEDFCDCHPFGTSLKVDGHWYWRTAAAYLTPLQKGMRRIDSHMECRCGS